MIDERERYERAFQQFQMTEPAWEILVDRRERKRRNQRITAGVVGIAVFVAAIWVVTSVGSLDRSETSVVPGGDVTGPAETGPKVTGPTVPAETGPAETGPAGSLVPEIAGPDPALSKVNVINLPPEGAPPSSPEHGELVLYVDGRGIAADRALTSMYLYADGRLIWWREGDLPAGATGHDILEQRLTPEGVELMRSEMIASGLFDRGIGVLMGGEADPDPMAFWGGMGVRDGERFVERQLGWVYVEGDTIMTAKQEHALKLLDARLADPASWLPASAWADQGNKVYVPTTYRVCYGGKTETVERDRLLHAIPGPVQELLEARDAERTHDFNMYVGFGDYVHGVRITDYCSELTTEEARDVVRGLDDGGFEREQSPTYANSISEHARSTFEYFFSVPDLVGRAGLWIDPNLPHEAVCMMC
jgi:hypothetical protein